MSEDASADWLVRVEAMRERGRGLARARPRRSAAASTASWRRLRTRVWSRRSSPRSTPCAPSWSVSSRPWPTRARPRARCSNGSEADGARRGDGVARRRVGRGALARACGHARPRARRRPHAPPARRSSADVDGVVGTARRPPRDRSRHGGSGCCRAGRVDARGRGARRRRGARRGGAPPRGRGHRAAARGRRDRLARASRASHRLAPGRSRTACRARELALEHALTRMLAGVVVVDAGWRTAMEVALAEPDLVVVTREGDRLGGTTPWRIGGAADEAVTQAALEEALARAAEASTASGEAERAVEQARAALDVARVRQLPTTSPPSTVARCCTSGSRRSTTRLHAHDDDAQARAEAQRRALSARASAYEELAERLDAYVVARASCTTGSSERRRRQSATARASAQQLEGLRSERAQIERGIGGGARARATRGDRRRRGPSAPRGV